MAWPSFTPTMLSTLLATTVAALSPLPSKSVGPGDPFEVPVSNPSFEAGGTGWTSASVGSSELWSPPEPASG